MILASGTLGQIIPPSVVLIVLADQLGISVGDLFLGALIPGLSLAAMYALYVALVAKLRPASAPRASSPKCATRPVGSWRARCSRC